jgi:hypothetical protein
MSTASTERTPIQPVRAPAPTNVAVASVQASAPTRAAPAPAPAVPAPARATQPNTIEYENTTYRLPDPLTMTGAYKLSIMDDKPILADYWIESIQRKVVLGVKEITDEGVPLDRNGKRPTEKYLIKTDYENVYTSPIGKLLKCGQDYIIVTENSIYLVDAGISCVKVRNLGTDE